MRTIIAGCRHFENYDFIRNAMAMVKWPVSVVVSGHAHGVDLLGERWAEENNIPIWLFPANWKEHGKSAGPKRNVEMADNADALVAFWDGSSKGTGHMIKTAREKKLKVFVFGIPPYSEDR